MSGARTETCDVLVIGSGAGGLTAAVTAALSGLDVLVAEKHHQVGGTSAWSGGWLWIPRNRHAIAAGIVEDPEGPRTYLRAEIGNRYDAARIDAFLESGPEMVAFLEDNTAVQFLPGNAVPDFHGRHPGAATGGRSVTAAPIAGEELGAALDLLRPPLRDITLAGMGIASGADIGHFFAATRKAGSFLHVARRILRHGVDLVRHGRGMHLVNGNALVARLLKSALDAGVRIRVRAPAVRLTGSAGRTTGAVLQTADGQVTVTARRAVVLATGGFPHDAARRRAFFPHEAEGVRHFSAAPEQNTGDGLSLGEAAGGRVSATELRDPAGWAPVSLVPHGDGTTGRFPHLVERGKPGLIAVTRSGIRFVDEAGPYHDFMRALFSVTPPGAPPEAWLICDHTFQRRYGLGFSKPFPLPLGPHLRSGYLKRGRTLADLAAACGIDPAGLAATVAAHNAGARLGQDPEFDRGGTPYDRAQGDRLHDGPNPCIAPIAHGPFYAVKVVPGSLGTFAGLATDADARVLDRTGQPVPGLFAVGADMASIFGGHYPSGGITLGPAMTFGFRAARAIAADAAAGPARPRPRSEVA